MYNEDAKCQIEFASSEEVPLYEDQDGEMVEVTDSKSNGFMVVNNSTLKNMYRGFYVRLCLMAKKDPTSFMPITPRDEDLAANYRVSLRTVNKVTNEETEILPQDFKEDIVSTGYCFVYN